MKKIYHIIVATALVVLAACAEEPVTTYLPAGQVAPGAISGIDEAYTIISLDTLKINPVIEGEKQDENQYAWYVYPVPSFAGSPRDTIGRDRSLDYRVTLAAGKYELLLEVQDKQRLTRAYASTVLNVTKEFSRGWFITKETGGATDVDFIRLGDNKFYADILQAINGERPAGAPVNNGYISSYYGYEVENIDGTVTRRNDQPAFFVATDADLHVYHANDMALLKRFDDAFFERPAVQQPRALFLCDGGTVLLNDANLHCLWYGAYNVGKLGYQVTTSGADVAPQTVRAGSGFILFDRATSSFVYLGYLGTGLTTLTDYFGMLPPCTNLNVDLVYMREQESYGGLYAGYALVKDKSTGAYKIIELIPEYATYGMMSPVYDEYAVAADREITTATVHALHNVNSAIYYSTGDNRVGFYNIANGRETRDIITLPEGEKIAHVRHVYNDNMTFQCLAVLANKDNRWTLYCYNFKGATSDVELPAFQTFSGDGNARSFLFRDVNITATN
ncbi:MAG: hypothetical protein LBD64_04675 [Odoribacteraceae bacterium]|jgi:hypothetical protein|nr:hypothetical protein [Odoribacteraceae bacterium]